VLSIIETDPALSLRVLRVSNSAAIGSPLRVSSVRQAVVMIGLAHIRQWAMLMVIDDVASATEEQMITALTRARLCETTARSVGAAGDAGFMAGLILGVAELLNLPPATMAHQIPLAADVALALVEGAGPLGEVLQIVTAYEANEPGARDLTTAYMEAMRWAALSVQATQPAK
jgi:EAL and modified HD-GYP domain-containing signal transduction protein